MKYRVVKDVVAYGVRLRRGLSALRPLVHKGRLRPTSKVYQRLLLEGTKGVLTQSIDEKTRGSS